MGSVEKPPFWNRVSTLVIAFAIAGPLALPLLWRNPNYSKATKVIVSVLMIAITIYLIQITVERSREALHQFEQLQEALKQQQP